MFRKLILVLLLFVLTSESHCFTEEVVYSASKFDAIGFFKSVGFCNDSLVFGVQVYLDEETVFNEGPLLNSVLTISKSWEVSYMVQDSYMGIMSHPLYGVENGFDILIRYFKEKSSEDVNQLLPIEGKVGQIIKSFFPNDSSLVVDVYYDDVNNVIVAVNDKSKDDFSVLYRHPNKFLIITGKALRKSE